jgi:ribose transport system ATP-binding protein
MAPVLVVKALEKSFAGVPVLKQITFNVEPGEIVALAGENGAGKSTLFKILTGQLRPDRGAILVDGQNLDHLDTKIARELGIGIVPQELAPYPELAVYENLFVGRELKSRLGLLKRSEMISEAKRMLEVFGLSISPTAKMKSLSTAYTQIVEIVKATTWGAKLLLLDEPTSSIPEHEVERLHEIVRALKGQGVAMVYTTHRMSEIEQLADRVLVMRDGMLIMDSPAAEATPEAVITSMIGRDLGNLFPSLPKPGKNIGLSVEDLVLKKGGPSVSFEVREGEILSLGGLVGAGRTEIIETIYGIRKAESGLVKVGSQLLQLGSPRKSIDSGIAIVPEDRKGAGLILQRSITENGGLPRLKDYLFAGFVRLRLRKQAVTKSMDKVALRSRSLDQAAGTLSGGNQQKIVIGRWLGGDTKVLLLDEPTRGVDVGARGEIYTIIRNLAASGLSVVLASSDTPELIGLSHRVLVVREGQITGELKRDELDDVSAQENIFRLSSGQEILNA